MPGVVSRRVTRVSRHGPRGSLRLLGDFLGHTGRHTRPDSLSGVSGVARMGMLGRVAGHHRVHPMLHAGIVLGILLLSMVRISSASGTRSAGVATHTGKALAILLTGSLGARLAWVCRIWVRLRLLPTPCLLLRLIKLR